ncbi:hypothetical protein FA95DRAFT_1596042 [Auriscalpium vulgare]|uniref:Uncharacterized protein n=1 Tax=Auriscalpium vulgare TaxID=40419 RepID=A0ACB8RSL5_9AGAM|nr:hypothetical protein FA95DRAFT_1596042 [Auriscalpium vulgare]
MSRSTTPNEMRLRMGIEGSYVDDTLSRGAPWSSVGARVTEFAHQRGLSGGPGNVWYQSDNLDRDHFSVADGTSTIGHVLQTDRELNAFVRQTRQGDVDFLQRHGDPSDHSSFVSGASTPPRATGSAQFRRSWTNIDQPPRSPAHTRPPFFGSSSGSGSASPAATPREQPAPNPPQPIYNPALDTVALWKRLQAIEEDNLKVKEDNAKMKEDNAKMKEELRDQQRDHAKEMQALTERDLELTSDLWHLQQYVIATGQDIAQLDKIKLRDMLDRAQGVLAFAAGLTVDRPPSQFSYLWRTALSHRATGKGDAHRKKAAQRLISESQVLIPGSELEISIAILFADQEAFRLAVTLSEPLRTDGNEAAHPSIIPADLYEVPIARKVGTVEEKVVLRKLRDVAIAPLI